MSSASGIPGSEREERDDEKLVYYRADFANARLFLRVDFDSTGKISCFQVIHV